MICQKVEWDDFWTKRSFEVTLNSCFIQLVKVKQLFWLFCCLGSKYAPKIGNNGNIWKSINVIVTIYHLVCHNGLIVCSLFFDHVPLLVIQWCWQRKPISGHVVSVFHRKGRLGDVLHQETPVFFGEIAAAVLIINGTSAHLESLQPMEFCKDGPRGYRDNGGYGVRDVVW